MIIAQWIVVSISIIIALLAFLADEYISREYFYMRLKARSYSILLILCIVLMYKFGINKLHLLWINVVLYSIIFLITENIIIPVAEKRKNNIGAAENPLLEPFIANFIEKNIGREYCLEHLAGDASVRSYYRVKSAGSSRVLCSDHGPGNSLESFMTVQRLMVRYGVPVPEIYGSDPEMGLILMEDLGNLHLEDYVKGKTKDEVLDIYRSVIDIMTDIQRIEPTEGSPFGLSFDVEKLMYEFRFFIEHCLAGYFNVQLTGSLRQELEEDFKNISQALYVPEYFVLAHRDYHSRNVLIRGNSPFIIDFQDARMGLPHYDLVSLLGDPYADLPSEIRDVLRGYYRERAAKKNIISMDDRAFDYYYDIMAYQRNIKAMGTYGYMVSVKNKMNFLPYIKRSADLIESYAFNRSETAVSWEKIRELIF